MIKFTRMSSEEKKRHQVYMQASLNNWCLVQQMVNSTPMLLQQPDPFAQSNQFLLDSAIAQENHEMFYWLIEQKKVRTHLSPQSVKSLADRLDYKKIELLIKVGLLPVNDYYFKKSNETLLDYLTNQVGKYPQNSFKRKMLNMTISKIQHCGAKTHQELINEEIAMMETDYRKMDLIASAPMQSPPMPKKRLPFFEQLTKEIKQIPAMHQSRKQLTSSGTHTRCSQNWKKKSI
jgi:hypothetical protein